MHARIAEVLAGIVTILGVHQPVILLLQRAGFVTWRAYSLDAVAPFGIPAIVSACLWGGLWTLGIARVGRGKRGASRQARAAIAGGVATTAVGAVLVAAGHGAPITGMSPVAAVVCSLLVNSVWAGSASWTAMVFCSRPSGRSRGQSP